MTELPPGASPVDAIEPGARLREWEIVRFVGRGSYGVVFEARRSSWLDEPPRALKIFDPIISSAARSALLGEFSTLTDVRHPHLLAGIDAFDLVEPPYAGCVVFVLELADEDLSHRVARAGPLPPGDAAAVLADVADGLAALHTAGRIHGDVKPENILRVGDRWVLGDFGVTSVLEGSYAVTHAATIDYRPPEAARAEDGTRQHRSADVWALGVSLHVAATGRHPFPGPDPMMRYAAALRNERAPAPGLDPGLASIIDDDCLVADPHQRLDAAGVAARLRAFGADAAWSGASAQPSSPPPSETALSVSPPGGAIPSAPGSAAVRRWLVLALAVVATVVLTQAVAVASGAMLTAVAARRVAYLVVSAGLLPAATVWYVRRSDGSGARPAPMLLAGCVAVSWLVSTVVLFV